MSIFQIRILSSLNKLLLSTADYILSDVIKSGRDVFGKDCSPVQLLLDQLVPSASYPVGARGRRAESVVTARNKAAEDLLILLRDLRIREHESCTQRGTDDTTTESAPSVRVLLPANHKSDLSGVFWDPWAGNTRKGQFVVSFYLRADDINFEKRCWPNRLTTRTNELLETLVREVGCDLEFWRLIRV